MLADDRDSALSICVVGAGPRGISVVERICENVRLREAAAPPIVIYLVDSVGDGGGRQWRTVQPSTLLMNTVASQVTMFTDESVECAGPIVTGPSLYEWARFLTVTEGLESEYPPAVRDEALRLGPDSYPSRSVYGHYLAWVLRRLISTCPARVSIVSTCRTVVALDDDVDGTQVVTLDDGEQLRPVHAVVLAQGHVDMELTQHDAVLRLFADRHGLGYVSPGSPGDVDLTRVRPGEPVGLRGMGLNFFDYMALLTIGRGGRFTEDEGGLRYRPSGREPIMYAGSRRGVPYHARGENQKGVAGRHQPMFLTAPVIRTFRQRAEAGEAVRFTNDLWPLVSREVRLTYHRTIITGRAGATAGHRFAREFAALSTSDEDAVAEAQLLDRHGVAPEERWDWARVIRPWGRRTFADQDDYLRWLVDYLREDVRQAMLGNVHGALKAALDVLRDLRNEIRLIVDHGGLSGSSYRDELQQWYSPLNAFLSIGPPVRRVREMIALVEAGLLRILAPGMTVRPDANVGCFLVGSASIADKTFPVTTLIEARLPKVDIRYTTDPLLRHLRATGQCSSYRIPEGGSSGLGYDTGGLAVTPRPYRLVDATGRAHPRRFAFGVPTETVHWLTAAGIRPGSNSVILADADALARASLAVLELSARSEVQVNGVGRVDAGIPAPAGWNDAFDANTDVDPMPQHHR